MHRQYGPINGVRFVSDDVAWCREHLTDLVPGVPVEYGSAGESMFDDLAAVAAAQRLVLGNSTFSYWGGFIASTLNPAAQVIGPAEHERGPDGNAPTWFPASWKSLPVTWLDDPTSPTAVGHLDRTPEVSVIIPCFNAAATLPMQLEALFTQEDAPPFEIIVVDNRSTDDLGAVVAAASPPPGVSLHLVHADAIGGAGYARNVGMAAARADLLMFCDADDVVSRWWVAHGIQAFREADVWSGSCLPVPDADFGRGVNAVRDMIGDSPEWIPSVREQDHTSFPILMGGDFGATAEALRRIGGFDVTIPAGGEDNDFAIRAVRAGYPAVSCKVARVAYRQRQNSRDRAKDAVRAARTHALLANRFGLWDRSHFRNWPSALARTGAAAGRMALRPRAEQDWWAVGTRAAVAAAVGLGHVTGGFAPGPRRARSLLGAPPRQTTPLPGTTVIVVAYNHEQFVEECLDSILHQTRPAARVLIADDCSPGDDTQGRIRRYCAEHPGFAEFHPNEVNIGLTRTLNRMLALVETEFVTYIAADDFMRTDRIEKHEDLLASAEAGVPLAYSDATVVDGEGNVLGLSSEEFPWPDGDGRTTGVLDQLVAANWIPAASMFMRTAELRRCGGYNEDLFYEDFELLMRLARHHSFAVTAEPLVTVRRLETSIGAVGFDPRSARFIRAQYVSLAHALGRDRDLDARVLRVLWELAIRARATGVPWWETVRMTWRARRGAPTMKAWGYRTALALIPRR
nr:glycosyltransferase [Helcobacillus sp. ACRRO]